MPNINLTLHVVIWGVLAVVVVVMFIWRQTVARSEDDYLHVADDTGATVTQQASVAHKLDVIDRWGKILTVVAVVYGLLVAGAYLWQVWTTPPGLE